jgi:hypothetical protein
MGNPVDLVGANVNAVYAGTTTDGESAPFPLGTRVKGTDGVQYMMVQAGAAISTTTSEPYALGIDENGQAAKLTTALATAKHKFGIAPRLVISDNDFFWARVDGPNVPLCVAASTTADVSLRTTTTAGRMSAASTASAVTVQGCCIVLVASASTSAGNSIRNALMSNPHFSAKGALITAAATF